jgi:hypothetical protein
MAGLGGGGGMGEPDKITVRGTVTGRGNGAPLLGTILWIDGRTFATNAEGRFDAPDVNPAYQLAYKQGS